jgi:hypothetical protein
MRENGKGALDATPHRMLACSPTTSVARHGECPATLHDRDDAIVPRFLRLSRLYNASASQLTAGFVVAYMPFLLSFQTQT